MFRARRVFRPLALIALVGMLVGTVFPAQAAAQRKVETWLTPGASTITVTGHGFGHGNGLSQYGALGAAMQGLSWRDIVSFYYPGTTIEPLTGKIRVLLTADTTPDLQVRAKDGLRVRRIGHARTLRLHGKSVKRWRVIANGADSIVQKSNGRGWRYYKRLRGEVEFSSTKGPLILLTPSGPRAYRGTLRSVSAGPNRKRETVNRVGIEAYLRGVVPREVPAEWEPDAVSAQSVAARTYAAFERASSTNPHYDLCDTTQCQVYGGVADEHPAADAAIKETAKQGLFYDGALAFTQFSASNGGYSSAGSMPYLVAQADPYDGVSGHKYSTWTASTDDTAIEKHWPAIGDLTAIEVTAREGNGEWGGRVTEMAFIGTSGTARVDGDTVRSYFGLNSTWFTFTVAPRTRPQDRMRSMLIGH